MNEPEIVKILKEEEKQGLFNSKTPCTYENLQVFEKLDNQSTQKNFFTNENEKNIKENLELENIEETYKTIFENYAIAVTLADKNERIVSWNKYTEELLNMNENELFKIPVSTLYPPDEWQRIRKENVRKKGIKYQMETRMIKKDKGLFDVELSLCILKGVGGQTVGSVGIIKDITKLKKTEKKLKESQKRYKTIFENSAVAITLTDEHERIISWNRYAEKLLDMDKNELSFKPVKSLYPPEEWKKIRSKNIRKKGMQHHLETKIIKKDHELLDVDISLSVLKDNKGKIIGSIGVITDISERKEAEQRLNSVMKYAGDSIYLLDRKYRYILANNELLQRFNCTKSHLLGKTINDLHSTQESKEFIKKIDQVFDSGKPLKYEHIKNDKWFLRTLSPVKDYLTGKTTSVLVISKDISEIKKTQEVLFENEKKYRSIFELSPEAIILLDQKGTVIDINARICEWLHYKRQDIIGKNILSLPFLPEDSKKKANEKFMQRMLGEKIPAYELEFVTKEGNKKTGVIQAIPIKDEKGKIISDLVVIPDITERKKMENTIKDSEEKYRDLFENANDIIQAVNPDGTFSYVNRAWKETLGYSEKEIASLTVFDIIHPDHKQHCKKMFKKIMSGENLDNFEITFITKDGKEIIVDGSISCRFKDDKPFSTRGIFRDITNRKKMESALRKSEEKFRVVLENSLDMIYQLNLQTNTYDYVSPSSIKVLGYTPTEIISLGVTKIDSLIHPEDRKKLNDHSKCNTNKENETIQSVEYRMKHKKLGYRWISDIRSVLFDDKGKAVAIVGNAKDITEQRKVWDEMVKSEEKYRVLAETSADGVFTTDVLGRLTYINPSLEKMMGKRKGKLLATPFKDYLSESSVYSFQQIIVDIRKNDQKLENIELVIVHGDGYEIPVEVNIAPLKKDGAFVGIECTVRDISEREKVVRELKKSENLRTEFMNIAAHELKSPVTPIKGYLELIESDKDVDEKIKKWARIALRNAERLLLLVNDILDVSRLDTDTMRFNMEKIDSVKILNDAGEDIKPAIENKKIKFIKEIPAELPMIFADKYRLSQVLKNLLGNAIKFTDYGTISLKAGVEKNNLIISVEDTGIGISNDELKKIFTKLYQAYTGEDRKNEGAGLGLYICKEIIKKHKGKIWATSQIGKGTKFFIQLPI